MKANTGKGLTYQPEKRKAKEKIDLESSKEKKKEKTRLTCMEN